MEAAVWLKELLNGAVLVLTISLVGLGFFIIFGMMRVINMAHGDLFMLGAYVAYGVTRTTLGFWWSLLLAPLAVGLFGIALERLVVRRLYGRPDLSTLLATWGVGIMLQQGVRIIVGPQPRSVQAPLTEAVSFLGISYPAYHLVLMAFCLVAIVGLVLLFARTPYGITARAAMENPMMASAIGVDTPRLFSWSFGLGAALAGFAGALLAPLIGALPTMGLDYLARAFFVVIMGGMTDLAGVLVSGLIVGSTETAFTIMTNATAANIVVLAVVILVMLVKPRGLFGGR